MNLLALTLAATVSLSFTVPVYNAPGTPEAGFAIDIASAQLLWQPVQSRTWRDSSAVMLAKPTSWARNWPGVGADCAPVQIMSVGLTWRDCGLRRSFTLPDTLHGSFIVTTRDLSGNTSAWSNWVTR